MSAWLPVIIFYSIVFLLIYLNRKKFDIQARFIALYRTKIGIKLMKKIAGFAPGLLNLIGLAGIIVAYLGLFWISFLLVKGFVHFFIAPAAEPVLGLVLPGITTPLWYTLISIFIVAVIHEFSHGVMSALYKVRVKNTGIVFFGPIFGAFVEPDEKKLMKKKKSRQLAVFAAGPVSNILMALILIFLFGFALPNLDFFGMDVGISHNITQKTAIIDFGSLAPEMIEYRGLEIKNIAEDSAAEQGGLEKGMVITAVNNISIKDEAGFIAPLVNLTPGQTITLTADSEDYQITTKPSPENASKGVIGINFKVIPEYTDWAKNKFGAFGSALIYHIINIFMWLIILNFGIGLANLLPLGPVDGGRILHTSLLKFFDEKRAYVIWKRISLICLALIIINILFPYVVGFLIR